MTSIFIWLIFTSARRRWCDSGVYGLSVCMNRFSRHFGDVPDSGGTLTFQSSCVLTLGEVALPECSSSCAGFSSASVVGSGILLFSTAALTADISSVQRSSAAFSPRLKTPHIPKRWRRLHRILFSRHLAAWAASVSLTVKQRACTPSRLRTHPRHRFCSASLDMFSSS